jgi:peptidoglycan/LPS O-acetylase OafA/YrhL
MDVEHQMAKPMSLQTKALRHNASVEHKHFPALDGLRGFAVLSVLIAHTHPLGYRLFNTGAMGVDVFFVLSGFLITSILTSDLDAFGRIRIFRFYIRRMLRLTPCLLLVVFASAVYFVATDRWYEHSCEIVTALTYTTNYAYWIGLQWGDGARYLRHTWSLAIEEQYYVVWPFVLLLLYRCGWSRKLQATILVLGASAIATYRASKVYEWNLGRLYHGTDTHCDGLLLGSALALIAIDRSYRSVGTRTAAFLNSILVPFSVIGLLGVGIFLHWGQKIYQMAGHFASAVAAFVIIFDLVLNPSSKLRPLLENRVLRWFGAISYGLYLWHLPIQEAMKDYEWIERTFGKFGQAAILNGASILISAVSFRFIERPILRLKNHF